MNIPISCYNFELTKLKDTILEFSESLKLNRIRNSNLDDDLMMVSIKNEEKRMSIEELETEISRSMDDIILL